MANDGGPAFPVTIEPEPDVYKLMPGMSLRDYFAAKAMELCDFEYKFSSHWTRDEESTINKNQCARSATFAYKIADAMLAAREAK